MEFVGDIIQNAEAIENFVTHVFQIPCRTLELKEIRSVSLKLLSTMNHFLALFLLMQIRNLLFLSVLKISNFQTQILLFSPLPSSGENDWKKFQK